MSLDKPELVDSVLTFTSGYDTLEYSWVKATAVSVRLRILFVTLQNTNKAQEHNPIFYLLMHLHIYVYISIFVCAFKCRSWINL